MSLAPVPNSEVTKGQKLAYTWLSWFQSLYQFLNVTLPATYASLASPAFTGTPTINGYPAASTVYGSFYDTTNQLAASATTAYAITINTISATHGVSRGTPTSRLIVAEAGTYCVSTMLQFENTDIGTQDIQAWVRKNGVDVAATNNKLSVPSKHGGANGNSIDTPFWVIPLNASDYIEVMWQSSSNLCSLQTYAAGATPVTPVAPSVEILVEKI